MLNIQVDGYDCFACRRTLLDSSYLGVTLSNVRRTGPNVSSISRVRFYMCIAVTVQSYIAEENKRGIDSSRIVVGGNSQGGAVALYSAFAIEQQPLAGVFVLSTWLPMHKSFPAVSWTRNLTYILSLFCLYCQ